jgi:phosphatidate cytidylyltransferase
MEIRKRLATATVLLAVLIAVIQYAPAWVLFLFLQLLVAACLLEFYSLAAKKKLIPQRPLGLFMALVLGLSFFVPGLSFLAAFLACLLAAAFFYVLGFNTLERMMRFPQSAAVTFFGALYLGATLNHFLFLRRDFGFLAVYFLFVAVFLGDTGAFLVGSLMGRHKMLPVASPRKTWEGAVGGLIVAGLAGIPAQMFLVPELSLPAAVAGSILISAVSQVSDPFESLFKRAAGVKDSGTIFPGHGGFLDRVDSLILAGPFFYYFLKFVLK